MVIDKTPSASRTKAASRGSADISGLDHADLTDHDGVSIEAVDELCAGERIHLPGAIQPHGVLLGVDQATGVVVVASVNATAILGVAVQDRTLADIVDDDFAAEVSRRTASGDLDPELPWETSITIAAGSFDVAGHLHDGLVLLEIEPVIPIAQSQAKSVARLLQRSIGRLRACDGGVEALARVAVEGLRRISGYERVLIYRFDRDWHGTAIAEEKVDDWEQSFLGLHFPASDIPRQARELYARSTMRWVPFRDYTPVPVEGAPGRRDARPVDLSFARLRSLSPVHLQYHRNMGVDGTMSVSVLRNGTLWGLVVCHHRRPHQPSPEARAAIAALTDAFALRVGPTEKAHLDRRRRADMQRLTALIAHMTASDDVATAATDGPSRIDGFFEAGGAVAINGEVIFPVGRTPPLPAIRGLVAWLRERSEPEVFHTDRASSLCPALQAYAGVASGVLAVYLSPEKTDLLVWLRPEEAQLVDWGGDPRKGNATEARVPRQSFDRWVERRQGRSRPWELSDLETADDMRRAVMDIVVRNLSRLANLNDQLRQSQKMEAVGQLTGGVAHDFNNLLTVIRSSTDLLKRPNLSEERRTRYVTAISDTVDRAAKLTGQLLAFARRQALQPEVFDAARSVAAIGDMVRTLTGARIRVEIEVESATSLAEASPDFHIDADPSQFDTALVNMVVNARDAMDGEGRLTIRVRRADALPPVRAHPAIASRFVVVSVVDTGAGIEPNNLNRIFEPFFTTKGVGQGTGLGLSQVFGFAKQSGGEIVVESTVGVGTSFSLYLPHAGRKGVASPTAMEPAPFTEGHGTRVLVVEDNGEVGAFATQALTELGFESVWVMDAQEALARVEADPKPFEVVFSDVMMPGMNGVDLAREMKRRRPYLPVVLTSGYSHVLAAEGTHGFELLRKPYSVADLSQVLRRALHARSGLIVG